MSLDAVANFIKINVVGTYDAAATDITVETGKGATLPTPPFNMVWYNNTNFGDPSDDSFKEIIRVNSILGDVLTVTRGQEGIAASVKNIAGVQYKLLLAFTKKSYDEISTSTTIADTVSATTWPLLTESVTGTLSPKSDAGLTYNASTANLAATTFTGALVGNATTSTNTTGNAATVTVADAASDTTTYPLLGIDLTGNMSPRTDTGLTYNADTNVLTTTTFVGALTGASSLNVLKAGDTMSGVLTQNGLSLAGTAYQNQSFQNLLKNGDFESWSAGTAVAPDGWTLEGAGASVARNGTNFKIGTYGVAITYGSVEAGLYLSDRSVSSFYSGLLGKTLTMGAWVKTSTGSQARVYLDDGITASYSSYHTGGGTWEFLTVSHTIAGNAIIVNPRMLISVAGTAYFDGAILVEGSVVPAFAPRPLYDDGKTLTVDSANNKVGIGTAAPFTPLDVHIDTNMNFRFTSDAGESVLSAANDANTVNVPLRIYSSTVYLNTTKVGIKQNPTGTSYLEILLAGVPAAANNAAAATAGVPVGGIYRTNADPSVVCIRSV